jgi:FkbM family methyltransferase
LTSARGAVLGGIVRGLKEVRSWPALNVPATALSRGALRLAGARSEFLVKHLPRSGTVVSRLPNGARMRLWSKGDDWVSNQVFWREWHGYEPETTPLFFRLAQSAGTVIDVGAHVGYYTLLAALANPAAKVYAFEPIAALFARLQAHVALNHLDNVTCHPQALGERIGTAPIYLSREAELPCSAGLAAAFYAPWAASMTSRSVPVNTLDSFVAAAGIGRVDLIKIDTETSEPEVLKGAAATLRRDRPDLIVEVLTGHDVESRLHALLDGLGYRYYRLESGGLAPAARIAADGAFPNWLFSARPGAAS